MFRDSGAFQAFFPQKTTRMATLNLLDRFRISKNSMQAAPFGEARSTSLGKHDPVLEPPIILDEGHKAYSPQAQVR